MNTLAVFVSQADYRNQEFTRAFFACLRRAALALTCDVWYPDQTLNNRFQIKKLLRVQ